MKIDLKCYERSLIPSKKCIKTPLKLINKKTKMYLGGNAKPEYTNLYRFLSKNPDWGVKQFDLDPELANILDQELPKVLMNWDKYVTDLYNDLKESVN